MKYVVERYTRQQLSKERKRLLKEKVLSEQNTALECLQVINKQLGMVANQNNVIINYLEKLTNGPSGDVHYIELANYSKTFGQVFIDFIRGDKNGRSLLPPNTEYTFPYSNVFMVKITNNRTSRHLIPDKQACQDDKAEGR